MAFFALQTYAVSAANKCELYGVVKDSISMEGLPFASVQILSVADSSILKGVMTDADGKYLIEDIQADKYIIVSSYMGYQEKKAILNIQSKSQSFEILLVQTSILLAETSITAEKSLVESGLEKTTINISKNKDDNTSSSLEIKDIVKKALKLIKAHKKRIHGMPLNEETVDKIIEKIIKESNNG